MSETEYRKAQRAREQKRKKRRQQQLIVLGVLALGVVIIILVLVLVFRSIFGKKDGADGTSLPGGGSSISQEIPTDELNTWPTTNDRTAWNLWLINEQNPVEQDFERPELVSIVNNGAEFWFDARMVDNIQQMIADCNAVEGHDLRIISGFRSYERQSERYNNYYNSLIRQNVAEEEARRQARELAALPGTSDHHTGLSVDFVVGNSTDPGASFAGTAEYAWLAENAANYGFVLRYPAEKEAITGRAYAPYHWRFVGVDDAYTIRDAGICLEEYLATLPTAAAGDQPANTEGDPEAAGEGDPAEGGADENGEGGDA